MPQFQTAVISPFTQAIHSFMSFLPALLGGIVVLLVGWWISKGIGRLLEKGLSKAGLERAAERSGVQSVLSKSGSRWTVSKIIGEMAKWLVFLIFVQAAANILGMPQVTNIINSIILFIPSIVVAMLILVIGTFVARIVSNAVRTGLSRTTLGNTELLARFSQYAIIGFSVIAALNQLGIAPVIVNTLFIGLVASAVLAVGLAFGLGSRDVASKISQNWYERAKTVSRRAPPTAEKKTGTFG